VRKASTLHVLSKGVASTSGAGKVSAAEQTRIRRARKKRGYFAEAKEEKILETLRGCADIVHDWPPNVNWWEKVGRAFVPPPVMTIDEWADRYRRIAPEFSCEPGAWNTKRVPYLRAIMRACSPSDPCQRIIFAKPSQVGGSEVILNALGYLIDLNPRSVLVIFPTVELAQSFSRERLEPAIELMPRLKEKVCDVAVGPDTAHRSSVGRKRFPGGFLVFGGANSAAGLSSRPLPVVVMDETDLSIQNAGSSGDPTRLLMARTSTFVDRKEIFIGSPVNAADENGILQLWHDSSQGTLETECPGEGCGEWQELAWERIDLESATLACVKCGQAFGQHEWNRGEEALRWRFDRPDHPTCQGFRMTALNSPWLRWSDLTSEYREAKRIGEMGDESLLRVFFNSRLARPYRVLGNKVELDLYNDRREVYPCHKLGAEVPAEVKILTAAIDVADRSLAYEVVGWGPNRESWGIETGEFPGDVGDPASGVWDQIDRFVYRRLFRCEDGRLARVRLLFIDSGGHHTTTVYKYAKPRQPRVFAIKGLGGPGRAMIVGGKVRERHEGAWLLKLGVDALKDDTFSRLMIEKAGPGFCHFPRAENGEPIQGYGESFFEELLAEQRVLRYNRGGFARYEYHKDRMAPNEALDLRAYNRAALEYLRVRLEQMPRDVFSGVSAQTIEEIEIGLGRKILVEKRGALRAYEIRPPSRGAPGPQGPSIAPGIFGEPSSEPPTVQWTGSASNPPKPSRSRYGAQGQIF
jgi:phage terminase large subunit GpA-like protein